MKISLRHSIQTRLLLITIILISFVLILLSFLSVYRDYHRYNQEVEVSLARVAVLVGDNSLASLLFDDPESATEILSSLKTQKDIVTGGLLLNDNKIFSSYVNPIKVKIIENQKKIVNKQIAMLNANRTSLFSINGRYAVYTKLIVYENKVAGKIFLVYDMKDREAALMQSVLIALLVFAISLLFTLVISYFLQRALIRPLTRLAKIMHEVAITKQFDIDLKISKRDDEIGWLLQGFQEMLAQLRIRDADLKKKNKDLKHLAYHDQLTLLPNYLMFKEVVNNAIKRRHTKKFCILFIDLDNFKYINDSFGHNVGDMYLQAVSKKFNSLLRIGDFTSINKPDDSTRSLARMGGDEFIVMLDDIKEIHHIDKIISRMFKEFETPLKIDSIELYVKLSIGIAIYPDDATDIDTLIKYADTAMYQVKHTSKNNYGYFNKKHHDVVKRKLLLEKEMAKAIELNQFKLYYQAKVEIAANKISGFEALLRWHHPTLGLISPVEFIPIAEMSRFIIPLGEWIINEACQQLRIWRQNLDPKLHLAINLSPLQFKSKTLCRYIQRILEENHLEDNSIELEITEGILMEDHKHSFQAMDDLRALGVTFSIDDFGTGYSSFQYLSKFNARVIKIDKIFIDDIDTNKENQVITNAIISLAHNMGMKVVAEGVETVEQVNYLKKRNCDIIQGYYFSKPIPYNEVEDFFHSFYSHLN